MYTRKEQFYETILLNPNLTEREIAARAGLEKTPYTRQILLTLIAEGRIARVKDDTRDRFTYVYFVQQTQPMRID